MVALMTVVLLSEIPFSAISTGAVVDREFSVQEVKKSAAMANEKNKNFFMLKLWLLARGAKRG